MRKINKMSSPDWFEKWKDDYKSSNGDDAGYEDLDNMTRRNLREQLISEQGKICCYCMRRINLNASHIEHFKPREKYKKLEMDYNNMFASCTGQENEAQYIKWHCDPRKDNWFDERMPELTTFDIEKCIKYQYSGRVVPYHEKNDSRHELEKIMIEKLGLNADYLVRNRRLAISKSELSDDVEYSDSDWSDFIRYYDNMHNGEYEEYCGMFIVLMNELIK